MLDWGAPPPVCAPRPSLPPKPVATVANDGGCLAANRQVSLSLLGGRRFYAKMKSAWLKLTTINTRKPELGSWLEEAPGKSARGETRSQWGAGCRICRAAFGERPPSTWASLGVRGKALKTSSIKRHMASRHHRTALDKVLGSEVESRTSPSLDEFMKVLVDRRKGRPHGSTSEVADREKICKMTWCLAEAAKDIERAHVRQSTVVACHQDARDQLFLIRYSAVSKDLKVMRGVLGIAKNFGTTSDDICKATIGILEDFCTPRLSPPKPPSGFRPSSSSVDDGLLQHLRSKIELFDADAATDEQRAGNILHGKSKSEAMGNHASPFLPNLKLVLRDRTHAATRHPRLSKYAHVPQSFGVCASSHQLAIVRLRRLTKKPWMADPVLTVTIKKLISTRGSITRLIANSSNLKTLFNARASINEESAIDCRKIRDLCYAKHRFNSTQKPLGRVVLMFDALLATAVEIAIRRAGREPATFAVAFLRTVTEEDLLTVAMLADAGDESAAIVRFFDCETYDVAESAVVISAYLNRIDCLFLRGGCLTVDGTYTKFVLDLLKRPHTITLHQPPILRSVGGGGVHPEVIDRCMSRMAAWVRLVLSSIAAEFPSWELLNAFAAFNLKLTDKSNFVTDSLCRLSNVFGLDADHLRNEFIDFRLFAQRRHAQGLDNLDSWIASIKKVDASHSTLRAAHPREQLRALVSRYAVFIGATTSGVERSFSAILGVIGKQRALLSPHNLANDIKLKLLTIDVPDSVICQNAMQIWQSVYGKVRLSGSARARRWVSGRRRSTIGNRSEAQWLRTRRSAVDNLASHSKKRTLAEMEEASTRQSAIAWTDRHSQARGRKRRHAATRHSSLRCFNICELCCN